MSSPDLPTADRRRQQGLSLVELLAGLVVGLLVVMAAFGALSLSREASGKVVELSQLQQQGSYALHVIGLQIRQAGAMDAMRNEATGLYAFGNSRPQAAGTDFAVHGTDGKGASADTVSVAFAAAAWSAAPGQFDCSGSGVPSHARVDATFETDAKGQLSCTGRRKQPVIRDVADFQVRYRVATGGGVQVMDARDVEAQALWGAVSAVEVCLDMQGSDKGPDLGLSYRGCSGGDGAGAGRTHLVFRNVFGLRAQ